MSKKTAMTYEQLLHSISSNNYEPIYVLDGEETYFTDSIVSFFEKNVIPEEEQDFNLKILYGREVNGAQIIEQARQYPMFGERQLVIVKDASHIKDMGILGDYLKQPM